MGVLVIRHSDDLWLAQELRSGNLQTLHCYVLSKKESILAGLGLQAHSWPLLACNPVT
jgi:hypothetical protein